MNSIDFDSLKDVEEFQAILILYNEAKTYVENFKWCKKIIKGWYDFGIYEKIGVFLFKIEPISDEVDDFIWIIVGDLPSAYLDCSVLTGKEALKIYCEIMTEWADNILHGKSVENCFPVNASPTMENANLLKKRINFIKAEILN